MQPNPDLITHRPRRHKERSLAPKDLRGALLQKIHRRIFAVDVIAHFRRSHRRAHLRRRPRHSIRSQINQLIHCFSLTTDHCLLTTAVNVFEPSAIPSPASAFHLSTPRPTCHENFLSAPDAPSPPRSTPRSPPYAAPRDRPSPATH